MRQISDREVQAVGVQQQSHSTIQEKIERFLRGYRTVTGLRRGAVDTRRLTALVYVRLKLCLHVRTRTYMSAAHALPRRDVNRKRLFRGLSREAQFSLKCAHAGQRRKEAASSGNIIHSKNELPLQVLVKRIKQRRSIAGRSRIHNTL